jgi:riboflavin kinase/FMN adenylyltransferase
MRKEPLFLVIGKVQEGMRRGRMLGFPTANVPCPSGIAPGIYAGEVRWKERVFPAALYKEPRKEVLEAHLLNFSGELYGERLSIVAYKKIREPAVFESEEKLIETIKGDIQKILECLQE